MKDRHRGILVSADDSINDVIHSEGCSGGSGDGIGEGIYSLGSKSNL